MVVDNLKGVSHIDFQNTGTRADMMWQPIETAPKGGGADMVTDPNWVEPPQILIYCKNGEQVVGQWDWYYADGGRGCTDGVAWIALGEQINVAIAEPTHWMPLPTPPQRGDDAPTDL